MIHSRSLSPVEVHTFNFISSTDAKALVPIVNRISDKLTIHANIVIRVSLIFASGEGRISQYTPTCFTCLFLFGMVNVRWSMSHICGATIFVDLHVDVIYIYV